MLYACRIFLIFIELLYTYLVYAYILQFKNPNIYIIFVQRRMFMNLFRSLSKSKKMPVYIPVCLFLVIVVLAVLLLRSGMESSTKSDDSKAVRDSIAATEYTQLLNAMSKYDTIGYPNSDITGDVLPTIEKYLNCANELDKLITANYGTSYSIFDEKTYDYMLQAVQEIDAAVKQGTSTTLGIENLGVYVLQLRASLPSRFASDGSLLPFDQG